MTETDTFLPPAGWISVFRANRRSPCEERALVLGAMQIEHRVLELPDGCHLLVPEGAVARAREQLRCYDIENPPHTAQAWPGVPAGQGLPGVAVYGLLLLAAYAVQRRYAWGIDWRAAGALDAGRVCAGELWRVLTALTLHADGAHVAGNLLFGAFFGYLAGQHLGSGIAWLAILGAAGAANLANSWVQLATHRSIGASTAVFAALGLVAAHVWMIERRFRLSWARRWAPVVGAIALLAYTGTGDAGTDVVAHLAGFVAGAAAGLLPGRFAAPGRRQQTLQVVAGCLALALVATSWWLALAALP